MSVKGPIWALRPSTVEQLSIQLNGQKLLTTDEGHLRDWRGLAELSGTSHIVIQKIETSQNPTKELFAQWRKTGDVDIEKLLDYLDTIDWCDVIDDNK